MNRKGQIRLRLFCLPFVFLFFWIGPQTAFSREPLPYGAARFSFPRPASPLAAQVSSRPRMVLVSRLGLYYAPDLPYNLYLLNKAWFYYYDGKWYQSRSHDGPWRYVPFSKVPEKLKNLPPELVKKENEPLPKKGKPAKKKSSKKKTSKRSK